MQSDRLKEIIRAATCIAWADGYAEGFDDGDDGEIDPNDRENFYDRTEMQELLWGMLILKFPELKSDAR